MNLHPELLKIDAYPELQPYKTQPRQMQAAARGKVGELRLGFSMKNGRSILDDLYRVAPLLVQQALYWDEAMPELPICSIISVGGGILQGDRYTIEITVRENACAQVNSQGFNRIQRMDANYASQYQRLVAESGAYLEYAPDFTTPYRDSRFVNHTDLIVAADATVLYGEMMMSGRKHHHADERFGFDLLSMSVNVMRPDGQSLFEEKVLIEKDDETVNFASVMKDYDAFANIMCLTTPEIAQRILDAYEPVFDEDFPRAVSGVSKLPNEAGLMLRVAGVETYDVKAQVRRFWKLVRENARNRTLPDYLWWR